MPTAARLPWWGWALGIWAASRAASTALLLAFAARQPVNPYTSASPSLDDFSTMWDTRWYLHVATVGYPEALPIDAQGRVGESAWAFMPVYPLVVRSMVRLGIDEQLAALGVAWAASAAFAILAAALLRDVVPGRWRFALALVLLGPVSPILQVAYAEGLHLALLAGALLAIRRRRWALLAVLVPLMALTRPSGLAFALALGIVLLWSLRGDARAAWAGRERWLLAASAAWALVWGLAWPAIAGWRTGRADAYVATELGWREPYVGAVDQVVPGLGWVSGAQWWLGGAGLTMLALLVGGVAWLLSRPSVRERLGVESWAWVVAYLLYLLAVWFPQSSTFRILLPAFPLVAALAPLVRGAWARAALLSACVVGQAAWVLACWSVMPPDWTVP